MFTRRGALRGLAAGALGTDLCRTPAQAQAAPSPALESVLREAEFSGAALVVRREDVLLRAGYGLADREHRVGNRPETRFRIASISKTITAGAVLTLAAAGKVDLDERLGRYVEVPAAWADIRVAQLLDHSSGLVDVVRLPGGAERVRRRSTLKETVDLLRPHPLEFVPGATTSYGNSGPVVAAWLVEQVSGRPFPEYVADAVYRPTGMKNSGFADVERVIPDMAEGYRKTGSEVRRASYIDLSVALGAGSEYSTVDDLHLWVTGLEAGRLVPEPLVRRMFTASGGLYGAAWRIDRFEGRRRASHFGQINGFGGLLARLPDDGVTVVLLSNMEGAPVQQLAQAIAARVLKA